jgi:DNA-binding response OmpR family regulator
VEVLIAEDDAVSRQMLEVTLGRWGYRVRAVADGLAAWQVLQGDDAPPLAILDWMMPELDGLEVCRRARAQVGREPPYLILLTARSTREDILAGLEGGADVYLTKPFDRQVLKARLQAGARLVELHRGLAARVRELGEARGAASPPPGLLPVCCYCKAVRGDHNSWQHLEESLGKHAASRFSHSICPHCFETVVRPQLESCGIELPYPGTP